MTEGLSYSIPAMQQGYDEIATAVAKLTQEHTTLQGELAPMAGAWQGNGHESWAAVQQRWDSANTEMLTVLQQIGAALQNAMEIYNTNESNIVAGWQG